MDAENTFAVDPRDLMLVQPLSSGPQVNQDQSNEVREWIRLEEQKLKHQMPEPIIFNDEWTEADEKELCQQFQVSDEKHCLDHGYSMASMANLWKVCFQYFHCSPFSLLSPTRNLAYLGTALGFKDSTMVVKFWTAGFCDKLAQLITHPLFDGNIDDLVLVLQFAAISRTDDKSPWPTMHTDCLVLRALKDELVAPRLARMPGWSISSLHTHLHFECAHTTEENIPPPSAISSICLYLGRNRIGKRNGFMISDDQLLQHPGNEPVYAVTEEDLSAIHEAIAEYHKDTPWMPGIKIPYEHSQRFFAAWQTPTVAQLPRFVERAWCDERRRYLRYLRYLECREVDALGISNVPVDPWTGWPFVAVSEKANNMCIDALLVDVMGMGADEASQAADTHVEN